MKFIIFRFKKPFKIINVFIYLPLKPCGPVDPVLPCNNQIIINGNS